MIVLDFTVSFESITDSTNAGIIDEKLHDEMAHRNEEAIIPNHCDALERFFRTIPLKISPSETGITRQLQIVTITICVMSFSYGFTGLSCISKRTAVF